MFSVIFLLLFCFFFVYEKLFFNYFFTILNMNTSFFLPKTADIPTQLDTAAVDNSTYAVRIYYALDGITRDINVGKSALSAREIFDGNNMPLDDNHLVYLVEINGQMIKIYHDDRIKLSEESTRLIVTREENSIHFRFDGQKFAFNSRYITGYEIARVVGMDKEKFEIWCEWRIGREGTRISAETIIDLLESEVIGFCSRKPVATELDIVVNGRPKKVKSGSICFEDLVLIAFGNSESTGQITYTVTYHRGSSVSRSGSLVEGDCVYVIEGMLFNVTQTDKS